MIDIKAVHLIAIAIGFTVFPLLGVIYFHTNGLIGGFAIGLVIAMIVSSIAKPEENKGEKKGS
ncbi:MAG: hypothetical protein AB1767_10945 [Bacillota bacterium]